MYEYKLLLAKRLEVIHCTFLCSVYNVKNHPKYQNGEWTEKQCMEEFLKSFEAPNSIDGKVS